MLDLNTKLFYVINGLATTSALWDIFFFILTTSLSAAIFWLVVLYLVWHRHPEHTPLVKGFLRRNRELFLIGISLVLTQALVYVLKFFFAQPRPFLSLEDVRLLLTYGAHDSFPSGHAAMFAALATSIFPFHKRLGIVVAVLALLIGFSRVYVGVHYPYDVVAGFCIGFLVPYAARKFFQKTLATPSE